MEVFPLPYKFTIDKDIAYLTRKVTFENGKEQIQQLAVNPNITWKIQCLGSNEQRLTLESFHARMAGDTKVFLFTDENHVQQQCRFAEPKLSTKPIREFSTTTVDGGNVVGFTADIVIKKVL